MHYIDPKGHSRRSFLQRSGALAMAGTAMPFALNLSAMSEAAAQTATDYKALVCVFLYGGNDFCNTVIPYDDTTYNKYLAIRGGGSEGGIAIPKSTLAGTVLNATSPSATGDRQYALHPSMTAMAGLFNTDAKLAVQLNVGPLIKPTTRTQFYSADRKANPVPPKLFSHNDQQSTWQSSSPEGSTVGWGGNIGDTVLAQNGSNSLFTCMSVSGNAVFLSGDAALQYQVSTGGAVRINSVSSTTGTSIYGSNTVKAAMVQLTQAARTHKLENEYTRVTSRAVGAEGKISGAIGAAYATGVFPATGIGSQLAMVARLIRGRDQLGIKRQVFFVSMGGFDRHDKLITDQAILMTQLSEAMAAFYREIGPAGQKLGDKVTTFTASDFGRTLSSNGDGSDHGWGAHHFVMGGAVKGKAFYGTSPAMSTSDVSTSEGYSGHVGQGRLIPTTSVDQYAATMAKWFGVPEADLPSILPNLKNFGGTVNDVNYLKDMGFMMPA